MPPISDSRATWLARYVLPHEPALRAWLTSKRSLAFDPDDLVQETYAILAALDSVDHILNPRAYMFQTAYSVALRQLRHGRVVSIRSVADVDDLSDADDAPSPEREVVARDEFRRVKAAIDALPRQCGEAFWLRKIEGLSQRDTAARMGLSESTIEKHVGRALRLLMAALGRGGKASSRASMRRSGSI